jgi:hypothetical protein
MGLDRAWAAARNARAEPLWRQPCASRQIVATRSCAAPSPYPRAICNLIEFVGDRWWGSCRPRARAREPVARIRSGNICFWVPDISLTRNSGMTDSEAVRSKAALGVRPLKRFAISSNWSVTGGGGHAGRGREPESR